MKEQQNENAAVKEREPGQESAAQGRVDLEGMKPTDTPGERMGEGDRTDTDEMHELNKDQPSPGA
jgi:hypothetical protein